MNSIIHFFKVFNQGKFSPQLERNFFLTGEENLACSLVIVVNVKVVKLKMGICQNNRTKI